MTGLEGEASSFGYSVGESDRWHGKPLSEAIVHRVREEGLAGATVIRGTEGSARTRISIRRGSSD
jgi:PII-like signaling protein